MTTEQKQEIEYEQVTIEMPKPIMKYLRFLAKNANETVEERIRYEVMGCLKADFEDMTGSEIVDMLGLRPIFKELLGENL